MEKILGQVRFYSDTSKENYPIEESKVFSQILIDGNLFENKNIIQLGIQTLPGVKFYLNNGLSPIMIGTTGVYEIDVEDYTSISSLTFDPSSIKMINDNENTFLIIDYIYQQF